MSGDSLGARKRALEEAFFAKRDEELLNDLKQNIAIEEWKAALAAKTGKEVAVIEELFQKGAGRETIVALALIPMVEVAWADGSVSSAERAAVLKVAENSGMPKDGPGYRILNEWLAQNPEGKLLATWKEYLRTLAPTLSEKAKHFLRDEVGRRAENVAKASGGFLGIGDKVSVEEEKVLREIKQTLAEL
jgi:hypothetical protein